MTVPTWEEALAQSADDSQEEKTLADALLAKPQFLAVVRSESAQVLIAQHDALTRWRWFRRWKIRGVLKVLAREEAAYRAEGSADR